MKHLVCKESVQQLQTFLLYVYFACLFVSLYPINVRTAEPIGIVGGRLKQNWIRNKRWRPPFSKYYYTPKLLLLIIIF